MAIHILRLHEISSESPDAASLHFQQAKVDRIHFLPGQFITLKVEIEGKIYFRSYSISSAPRLDDVLSITIKRVAGGLVSNYILDHFKSGQLVEFLAPKGRFIVENSIKNERRLILIGGGSGITPLMSILRSTLFNEPKSRVSLIYASRDAEHIIFKDKLQDLKGKFGERLEVHHILSRENKELAFPYHKGRLNTKLLDEILEGINPELARDYFLCGPTELMELVHTHLLEKGIPEEDIRQEKFLASEQDIESQIDYSAPSVEVLVWMGGTQYNIKVPPGSTVLRAAIDLDIDLPHSCLRGICASCMGKLEQGEVNMLNNETLLDFEVEAGKVLVCQSQPKSEDVVIRMGADSSTGSS
ncbi:MAG: ferredoxin--NADP reductase [Bacteroidia bacterium]|nr:ferredoxin--NADP reductase [Bacteroidia bacterium]